MSSANEYTSQLQVTTSSTKYPKMHHESTQVALIILWDGCKRYVPNFASDILVNVVRTNIALISISFSSLVLIFVLVLVSSMVTQNVFLIFVIVFVVVDENLHLTST